MLTPEGKKYNLIANKHLTSNVLHHKAHIFTTTYIFTTKHIYSPQSLKSQLHLEFCQTLVELIITLRVMSNYCT